MVNPDTGRVHTNYAQAVAVTGRLASNEPNLQNIPVRTPEGRRVREAFVAPPGHVLVSADYSQIELRIMAHLSDDPALLQAFAEGLDVHRATAAEVFGVPLAEVTPEQRRYAKTINFGLIYGMGAFGLAQSLGIEPKAARDYIERYFARYPGVRRFMDETRAQAAERGHVETLFGRRIHLVDIRGGSGPRRAAAERQAINAPMQGTASDLIKRAMLAVQDAIDVPGRTPADPVRSRLRASSVLMGWGMEDLLERADAMRSRGWGAATRRTTYARYRLGRSDVAALAGLALFGAVAVAVAWTATTQYSFYPQLSVPAPWLGYVVYAAWMMLPCALHAIDEKRFG